MADRKPDAMECWHFIAPLIPLADELSLSVYVKTFYAFQLLEAKEKGEEQEDDNDFYNKEKT